VQEFPVLDKVAEKFAEQNVAVLTINNDRRIKSINAVLDKVETSRPVLRDVDSEVFDAYRAQAVPTIYLIDQQGRIYSAWTGKVKDLENELGKNIDFVVKHPPAADVAKAAVDTSQTTE
jgi:peroxiredoxin